MYKTAGVRGFTIVELLIVIVVIGILAAITVVAFNGIQDRARVVSVQSDLKNLHSSLRQYREINDEYPVTGTSTAWSWRFSCVTGIASFIPGLTTSASKQAPCSEGAVSNDTWLYGSDGIEYKLIHLRARFTDAARESIPETQHDIRWSATTTAYGYWSPGAVGR